MTEPLPFSPESVITCPKCDAALGVDRQPGTHYTLIHEGDGSHTFEPSGQNTPVSTPSGPSAGLEGQGATQETPDATEAAQRRVERYAEGMAEADGGPDLGCFSEDYIDHARAAIAVADQEQAELRAEVANLQTESAGWQDAAGSANDRAEAAEARVAEKDATIAELRAEVERLRKPTVAAVMGYELGAGDLEHAESRVAELEAKVRALADECADSSCIHLNTLWGKLRALTDAPKDTTETPCPTCSGPSRETVGMVCQTCGTDYAPKDTTAP